MNKDNYFDLDVISYIDLTVVLNPFFEKWYEIVEPILKTREFQKRKLFMHHHNMSVWDHSVLVSFRSFMVARIFHADERICAIAGLLHDFYPHAWIKTKEILELDDGIYFDDTKKPLFKMHGFVHAREAAQNYVKFFPELENEKITNCIKRHMFPLNIVPPKYKEGIIITIVDKYDSVHELPSITYVPQKVKEKVKKMTKRRKKVDSNA